MRMVKGRFLALITFGVAAFMLVGGTALAADLSQEGTPSLVDASATPTEDGEVEVTMKFANSDGQAVSGQEVSFFLGIDFLGQSEVSLGSAKTDSSGLAKMKYVPTRDGTQYIGARLGGSGQAAFETAIEFDVAGSRSAYHAEPPALSILRQWLPPIIGVVVLAVWATIGLVAVLTTFDIVTLGRSRDMTALRYPVGVGIAASRPLARQPREQIRRPRQP